MNRRDPNGEPEGMSSNPNALELSAATSVLMKDVIRTLTNTYIGFRWAIQPDERGAVFNIFCLDFSARYGYVIRFSDVQDDPERKQAIRAAGEILARFHYHGRKYDPTKMAEVVRRPDGEAVPDLSDGKRKKVRDKNAVERAYYGGKAYGLRLGNQIIVGVK